MGMPQQTIKYGDIVYDLKQQSFRRSDGKELKLRPKSLQVFLLLAENPGELISKDQIITAVWDNVCVTDDSLVQCIADIRRVLQDTQRTILKTVPRKGYIFFPPQQPTAEAAKSAELLPFLGRKKELSELQAILQKPACRLIVMLGLGGVGKSCLALALQKQLQASKQYPDGVHFIPLATLQNPELIPEAIANKLGISLQGTRAPIDILTEALRVQETLLILDNIEHLLPDVGACLTLLTACSKLKILITSRLPVQLKGEWIYQLQGFQLPDAATDFTLSAAYQLFIQTAQRINHAFQPEAEEKPYILEICRLVSGMPLGIEIAARWVQHLSSAEIVTEMRQYLLNIREHDAATDTEQPAELNTILRQSWDMLTGREQMIMQTLALFRDNFTREAAAATANIGIDDYAGLINKSMLTRNAKGRYVLHEVMRRYANKRRNLNSIQHTAATQRFFDYHLDIATTADRGILGGTQLSNITQLKSEHANLRECLSLCHPKYTKQPLSHNAGLELVGTLGIFWFLANHWQEGRQWASNFLELSATSAGSNARAKALLAAGNLSIVLDDYTAADKYLNSGTEMSADKGVNIQYARGLAAMGVLRRLQGRLEDAVDCGQRSMAVFEAAGEPGGCQFNLGNVGHALLIQGAYDAAEKTLSQCIQLNQDIGLTLGMPYALVNLGRLHWQLRQAEAARLYLQRAVQISEKMGVILYRAQALCTLGWIEASQGNVAAALSYFQNSAQDYLRLGEKGGLADCMWGITVVKTQMGELKVALQFVSLAEELTAGQVITNRQSSSGDTPHLNWKLQELTGVSTDNQTLLDDAMGIIQKSMQPEAQRVYRNLALTASPEELLRAL